MPSRLKKGMIVSLGILVLWLMLVLIVAMVPSKLTVENNRNSETRFVNLSEKVSLKTSILTSMNGLERIDVLFKNPNLESRDELQIIVTSNGKEIVSKPVSGFNLGDTSHARVDIQRGLVGKDEHLDIEVVMTRQVDGKLMVGVKNDELNMIQYYGSGSKEAVLERVKMTMLRVGSWPLVLILPLVVGFVSLW